MPFGNAVAQLVNSKGQNSTVVSRIVLFGSFCTMLLFEICSFESSMFQFCYPAQFVFQQTSGVSAGADHQSDGPRCEFINY